MNLSNFLETSSKEVSEARKRFKEAKIDIKDVMQNMYRELSVKYPATMHDDRRICIKAPEGENTQKLIYDVLSSISTHISPEFAIFAFKIVCRIDAVEILKRED